MFLSNQNENTMALKNSVLKMAFEKMAEYLFVERTGQLIPMRGIQSNFKGIELDPMKEYTYCNFQICP